MSSPDSDGLESLPGLLTRANSRRILLLTGESQRHVARIRALLAGFEVEVYAGARRHVPEAVLGEARQKLDAFGADTIVALGGGSAIGLGKALRLARDVRFVAIPTTYAGSEMTNIYGTTAGGTKTTGRDPKVRPDAVIHEVELTLGMPKALTVTSLMNALAHPIGTLGTGSLQGEAREQAFDAIGILYGAIEALVRAPDDRRARAGALRGAALAARALESGTPGLHHKLAHRLGGRFDLDHAGLHSVLLPHSLHRLRGEAPDVVDEIGRRLAVPDLEGSLFDFLVRAGAGVSLRALGVTFDGLRGLLAEATSSDLPRDLLSAAFHGRRPSVGTRFEDWGLPELVSVTRARLEDAPRVVVCLHGRGAAADGILGRAVEIVGNDPTVCVVAPQAPDNVWYSAKYTAPRAEIGPQLASALDQVATVLRIATERSAPEKVVMFGFSQGGCLAIESLLRGSRPAALVALSGAIIGPPEERPRPGAGLAGTPVLLGAQEEDPWNTRARIEETAQLLAGAGCAVTVEMLPGNAHALHVRHRILARQILSGKPAPVPAGGYGNVHESETLPGALPRDRNSPRHGAYGLYPEQINGTGFVAPRQDNRRTWMYRIRPAAQQGPFAPLPHATLKSDFADQPPEPNLVGWNPQPLPDAGTPTDFVDGLATVGGAGSPRLRRGFAVHVYAANRGMEERASTDADGDLLISAGGGRPHVDDRARRARGGAGSGRDPPPRPALQRAAAGTNGARLRRRGLRPSLRAARTRSDRRQRVGRRPPLPRARRLARGSIVPGLPHHRQARRRALRGRAGLLAVRRGRVARQSLPVRLRPRVVFTGGQHPHRSRRSLGSQRPVRAARRSGEPHARPGRVPAPLGRHRGDLPPAVLSSQRDHRVNGIIRDTVTPGSPFVPGGLFVTPSLTPHGVVASSVERHLALDDAHANRPQRSPDSSLWFQFETALPFSLSGWARGAGHRIADWPLIWGAYRKHFWVPGAD